jgi:hypothetical protein
MSATGPTIKADSTFLPTQRKAVAVSGTDTALSSLFNAAYCRRVRANAAGVVSLQGPDDGATFTSYNVSQGDYIDGIITSIGSSARGTTVAVICEL